MPDDDIDFEAYLRYLYQRDIAPAVQRYWQRRNSAFEYFDEFEDPLRGLAKANSVLRLNEGTDDIYSIIRPEALTRTLLNIREGLKANESKADELGFSELIDSNFLVIARRMTPAMVPTEEMELLRQFGFPDVAAALPFMVISAREQAETAAGASREVAPSRIMHDVQESLEPAINDHQMLEGLEQEVTNLRQNDAEYFDRITQLEQQIRSRRKPRRWWNAARKAVQGVATSLADMAAAVGVHHGGASVPDYLTIISIASGVSTLSEAWDELSRR